MPLTRRSFVSLGALAAAPVRAAVHIAAADFMPLMQGKKTFADLPHLAEGATQMLDQLVWWTGALKAAREKAKSPVAA